MIDIIFGDVLVVLARFLATEVVTLRCSRLSDIASPTRLVYQPRIRIAVPILNSQTVLKTLAFATLVFVVVADFDVLEDAQGVVGQDRTREIQSEQIRCDPQAVESHQPGREARA